MISPPETEGKRDNPRVPFGGEYGDVPLVASTKPRKELSAVPQQLVKRQPSLQRKSCRDAEQKRSPEGGCPAHAYQETGKKKLRKTGRQHPAEADHYACEIQRIQGFSGGGESSTRKELA